MKRWVIVAVGVGIVALAVTFVLLWHRRAHGHARREIDFAALGHDFAQGLASDPYFDADADRVALLANRDKLVGRDLYNLILGDLAALAAERDPDGRGELRRDIDRYAACARLDLSLHREEPPDLDRQRFEHDLAFLAALAWLLDQRHVDHASIEQLRACRQGPCDYQLAARAVLDRTGEDDDYGTGLAAWAAGDFAKAVAAFDRQLTREPDDAEAATWRGLCRLRLGNPQLALADFDTALRTRPGDAVAIEGRGHALFRMQRVDDAIAAWEQAARLDPRRAPILREYERAARNP